MQTHTGGCHCGRVRFEITTDLSRASECNCSMFSLKTKLEPIGAVRGGPSVLSARLPIVWIGALTAPYRSPDRGESPEFA